MIKIKIALMFKLENPSSTGSKKIDTNPIIMTPTQIAYDLSWTVKALNLRAKTLVKANPIPPIMA